MKRFKILWLLSQTKALQFCADDAVWCNGVKDCIDGRDEIGCPNYNCANGDVSLKVHNVQLGFLFDVQAFHCGVEEKCLDSSKLCDGNTDCSNGNDERACYSYMSV